MSEMLYNFAAKNSSLDDINGHLSATKVVRSDIDNVFNIVGTVYEGEGATALGQAHQKFSAMLDDSLNNASNTQKFAQDQQAAMQALDRATTAAF
jgi:hypothetical protein